MVHFLQYCTGNIFFRFAQIVVDLLICLYTLTETLLFLMVIQYSVLVSFVERTLC